MLIGSMTLEVLSDRTPPVLHMSQHRLPMGFETPVTASELRDLARYLSHEADKLSTNKEA